MPHMQGAWQTLAGFYRMCTIAFLVGVIADSPLVIAANRDEFYARPTRPPQQLGDGLVGGVDVLSGGTWLAVRADGAFAAVTNQRVLAPPPAGLRSRGLAVRELAAASDMDAYVRAIDPTRYASMNLAWGDAAGVSIAYARQEGALDIVRLERGVHVLCNGCLGRAEFPRGERLRGSIDLAVSASRSLSDLLFALAIALGDHTMSPRADASPSPLPQELARAMTAVCIHSETYGTRSATLFAAAPGKALAYRASVGPPCTTPFIDHLAMVGAA